MAPLRLAATALACAALLAVGCLNYDERIEIKPDGSGTVRVMLSLSEDALAGMEVDNEGRPLKREIKTEDDLYPRLPDLQTGRATLDGKDQIVKSFTSNNMTVRSIRASSVAGMRNIYIVADFRDFNRLPRSDVFADRECTFRRHGDGTYEIRMVVANEAIAQTPEQSQTFQMLKNRFGEPQARMFLSSYNARFSIEAPGAIVETNGGVWKESKALWSRTLLNLLGSGRLDLRVRSK